MHTLPSLEATARKTKYLWRFSHPKARHVIAVSLSCKPRAFRQYTRTNAHTCTHAHTHTHAHTVVGYYHLPPGAVIMMTVAVHRRTLTQPSVHHSSPHSLTHSLTHHLLRQSTRTAEPTRTLREQAEGEEGGAQDRQTTNTTA
eukprot:GHVU01233918.1.p1 GENE.GHVU01233918.1~~GHVU01233918.1.p1  ORF type:complete len:143 (-),score=12.56 GHVU01233918.1:88-516(-)